MGPAARQQAARGQREQGPKEMLAVPEGSEEDRAREGTPPEAAASVADRAVTCRVCLMPDPPPEQTCYMGADHIVGALAGCPACLRLTAACAARPCSARQGGRVRRGTP